MSMDNSGKIILISDSFGNNNYRIFRMNSNGSVDTTFNFTTLTPHTYGRFAANAILPNDKIIIGVPGTIDLKRIKQFNSNGSLDTTFDIGTGFNGNINFFYMQPNGGLLVGGSFKSFQGVTERSLVRLTNQSFLDVNTNEPTQKIFLYPNPTKDILHFSDINENIKYQITNLFGQLVQKGVVVNKQVSTESLQNGMYIIEIQNGTQKNRYKFLKQL
jgi:hypothetical protein